jgi:hypothetical protein
MAQAKRVDAELREKVRLRSAQAEKPALIGPAG